ncbi:MAG: NAD-dependent epimerase/dehydratase family protein [Opitutaceae bacterium]|nr:NAD-dependent epimerase/dehydratase family protein [Opitutaceae bacterium]
MKVLVTGAAGFIGFHACQRLARSRNCEVLGVDNLNEHASVELKRARLAELEKLEGFRFVKADFADASAFNVIYEQWRPDYVVHLGAQTGVRYSFENPAAYVHSNLDGFASVLEAARRRPPRHLVFASSSSIYGSSARVPFREEDDTGHPLSFYAATKKANEAMAYSYVHMHGLHITGLRFFTVYGPWGRPDMAPILFARAICEGTPVRLYNQGRYRRDFTYVDDIVDGVLKVLLYPSAEKSAPGWQIFNIGHNRPVEMAAFVQMLEAFLGRKAQVELLPSLATEMPETCADLTRIRAAVGYEPKVLLEEGLRRFGEWFKHHYGYR